MALRHCPQKKGVVHRIYTESPKKPNSAKRKVARVRLVGTTRHLRVKVPGPGHGSLARFGQVLIRGAHPRDLPGIRYSIIRGKLGSNAVFSRRKGHSKYGLRKRQIEQLKLAALGVLFGKDSGGPLVSLSRAPLPFSTFLLLSLPSPTPPFFAVGLTDKIPYPTTTMRYHLRVTPDPTLRKKYRKLQR
jgi:small subunit ribosomal protein S12